MTLRRHSSKGKSDCLVVPYTPLYSIWCVCVCVCAPIWIGEGRRSISVDLRLNCRALEKPDYLKNATRRRDARTIQNMASEFSFDWFMPKRKPRQRRPLLFDCVTPLLKYARQLIIPLCSSHNSPTPPPQKKNRIWNVKDHCFYAARDIPINDVYRRARWISLPFDFCLSPKVSEKISRKAVCACLSFSKMDVYLYRRLSNFHLLFISHLDIDVSFACYSTRLGCQTNRSLCPYSRKKRSRWCWYLAR